jgi:hypothetical protein
MDFIIGLSLITRRHDSIFLAIDTLMNNAHFILVRTMYQEPDITIIFANEIVRLHGIPRKIIFDRGLVFT